MRQLSRSLEDGSHPLAAAYTHCNQAQLITAQLHFFHQFDGHVESQSWLLDLNCYGCYEMPLGGEVTGEPIDDDQGDTLASATKTGMTRSVFSW